MSRIHTHRSFLVRGRCGTGAGLLPFPSNPLPLLVGEEAPPALVSSSFSAPSPLPMLLSLPESSLSLSLSL